MRAGKMRVLAEKLKLARLVRGGKLFQHEAPEQRGEHEHRQEEAAPAGNPTRAVRRDAAAGRDHVHMRVMGHCRTPGMEHGDEANPGAKMFGIGADDEHRFGGRLEQQIVDHDLVLIGDVRDRRRQGEHLMEVRNRQQFGLAGGKPFACRRSLALWAVPVHAAVIGDALLAAGPILAARDMAAERCDAAVLDGTHDFELAEADMAAGGMTPSSAVIAENIRDLQRWTGQGRAGLLDRLRLSLGGWCRQREAVEWALDGAQDVGGHVRVAGGRFQFGMSKKHLDDSHAGPGLHEMGAEGMPERVRRDPGPETGGFGGGVAGAVELTVRDR